MTHANTGAMMRRSTVATLRVDATPRESHADKDAALPKLTATSQFFHATPAATRRTPHRSSRVISTMLITML